VKEIYILATQEPAPVSLELLAASLEGEGVELVMEQGLLFSLRSAEARTDVRFEPLADPLGWAPEFLTGTDESQHFLKTARGFYRISIDPACAQPSVCVFEALWCVRSLMEHVEGVLLDVTAFKLHDASDVEEITELDFDIRDHINLHALAMEEQPQKEHPGASLWVHSHGMDKFGALDVEVFQLSDDDLLAAETFLHTLCTDLAFGHGPPLRTAVDAGEDTFMLVPAEEGRQTLMGVSVEAFEGHEGNYLTVVSGTGRHNLSELLAPYREHFEKEPPERTLELRLVAQELLPSFKARFLRKGLMEPWGFRLRAPFESHPAGEEIDENLWVEVLAWEQDAVIGKLLDGSAHTTEWRKGAQVRIEESSINALAIARGGRVLEEHELRTVLAAERPA
jgi:hypothetical protein